ncbi:restriction endonuclease subunit S [Leptospira venezuelensis]|uniref:restriction endonuclease subunit S n=1 Tax=Leptospira venezuelensis TaxID=1958811 RepID=UPI000A3CC0F8|nr:restriction endonuclease subunit S [Leptospira venezuelensis]
MKFACLSQLSDKIYHGGTPSKEIHSYWNGNIPWISSADIDEFGCISITRYITEEGLKNSAAKLVPRGSLIIVNRVGVGKAAIAPFDLCFSQDCLGLILNEEIVDVNYCIRMLKEELPKLRSRTRGATIQGISKKEVEKIAIPLPPLSKQIQIAEILSQAETLIAKRKESIRLLDELVKSQFLEMFGDPVKNEKGWEVKRLGEVLKIKHGHAFQGEYFSDRGEYVLLTPGNFFESGGYRDRGDKQKYYVGPIPSGYILEKGDLLIAMTEQTSGLLGSPLIVPGPGVYLHNQRLGLVELKGDKANKIFLFHLFNFYKVRTLIHSKATGTKVRHTSPSKIEDLTLGIPEISEQNQFADFVINLNKQKVQYIESLRNFESLYFSLSQKAFRGELTFAKETVILSESKSLRSDIAPETISKKRRTTEKSKKPKVNSISLNLEKEEKFFLKRKVLGSYIINQSLEDSNLGDVKFEKLLHLSEYHVLKRNFGQHYIQKVAGPYDNKFTINFFQQIERDRWFLRLKKGKQFFFKPGEKHDSSTKTYNYFSKEELSGINGLIQLFRKADFEQVEIVSTLYAVWNNRIIKAEPIVDTLLKEDFLNWAPEKIKYKDRVDGALAWMREKGILPDGWGPLIEKAE